MKEELIGRFVDYKRVVTEVLLILAVLEVVALTMALVVSSAHGEEGDRLIYTAHPPRNAVYTIKNQHKTRDAIYVSPRSIFNAYSTRRMVSSLTVPRG